jgi:hypothetical protein
MSPNNLLSERWADLNSDELRLLLRERFGRGLGQYDGDDEKLYLPFAGGESRIVLTYADNKIATVEPGEAFDPAEWEDVSREIEGAILAGALKTGRDYSFSTFPVLGSWRGCHSGLQILPAPDHAPRAAGVSNPFILEFPIKGSDLSFITNHRRIREHRRLTLLLNLLLAGNTSLPPPQRGESFWAHVPRDVQSAPPLRLLLARLLSRLRRDRRGAGANRPDVRWVPEWYYAPLDHAVLDEPSPSAAETLEEVEPEEYYATVGNDGPGLRAPTDLDNSICRYFDLSAGDRARFDRATFWLDMASRQWHRTSSASATFAAYVSAIEALSKRPVAHPFNCPVCGERTQHEVPGATRRFKDFLETYAPGAALAARRDEMYSLRSGILHGSKLIEIDYALALGWDPPWWNQRELLWDLASLTRIALRGWLKSPPAPSAAQDPHG